MSLKVKLNGVFVPVGGGVALPPGALVYRGVYDPGAAPSYAVDEAVIAPVSGQLFRALVAAPASVPSLAASVGATPEWVRQYPPQPEGYELQVVADSPLAYWRLGEPSGAGAMLDSSGNDRRGSFFSAPSLGVAGLVQGDANTAASFNGSNQFAQVASAGWMNVSTITLEAVIKPAAIGVARHVVDRDSGGADGWWLRLTAAGAIEFSAMIGGTRRTVTSSVTIAANTAHHIAGTFDGTTMRVYVDGVERGALAVSGTVATNARPITVAANSTAGFFFNGVIDEVAVYGTPLSASRLLAHAQTAGLAA